MLTSIAGHSVIVTGGSKGIGKGIARVFASKGAQVLISSRNLVEAEAAAAEIRAAGGSVTALPPTSPNQKTTPAWRRPQSNDTAASDILCCNAGIYPSSKIFDLSEAEWDLVMDVNLKGTFLSVQACLPALKARGKGRVVVTSSITGPITGNAGWSHYSASKAGQLGFLRTAAIELAPHNITINAVLPGNILTEGLVGLGPEYMAQMTAAIPMRKVGSVEDVAYAALFLASEEAAYITGQTIVIDGGQVLPESLSALAG